MIRCFGRKEKEEKEEEGEIELANISNPRHRDIEDRLSDDVLSTRATRVEEEKGERYGPSFMLNFEAMAFPHQPFKAGNSSPALMPLVGVHFSCTKMEAMPPAPEFRYLYVHQTAKSTFQSCRCRGTFPTA